MRKSKFKFMDKEEKNVEMVHLSPYMKSVIERLTADKKRPAVHTYNATLNSFTKFSGGQGTEEMLVTDVFTAGKLKEYEAWLRSRNAKLEHGFHLYASAQSGLQQARGSKAPDL